jgi:hypothetical protein
MIITIINRLILSSFVALIYVGIANATVITFDDLNQGLVPSDYAGLSWGTSTLSQPYADFTSFSVSSNLSYSTPRSASNYVLNGYGVPDLWFEFIAPVNFNGAWFAAPFINMYPAQKVRFIDDLGQASEWLNLTNSPQYLVADFLGSKTIYVQPTGVFSGIEMHGGWYTMDDITYTEITPVPEPSTILLLIIGFTGIIIFARKHSRFGSRNI